MINYSTTAMSYNDLPLFSSPFRSDFKLPPPSSSSPLVHAQPQPPTNEDTPFAGPPGSNSGLPKTHMSNDNTATVDIHQLPLFSAPLPSFFKPPPPPPHPLKALPLYMQSRVPTDEDAPGEDDLAANEQLRGQYRRQYEAKTLRELRIICIQRQMKIRGSKAERVDRVVAKEMQEVDRRWV
ncbi:Nn.00g099940.m01.CDS01 [Neocucurbitaria sp. VM-36]